MYLRDFALCSLRDESLCSLYGGLVLIYVVIPYVVYVIAPFLRELYLEQLSYTYILTYYSLEQSPSWEANRFSASQEIPRILWNPKVHCRIHNARHLSQSWTSSIQFMPSLPTFLRSILVLSSQVRLGLSSGLFPSGFPTKTVCTLLLSPYALHAPPTSFVSIWSTE